MFIYFFFLALYFFDNAYSAIYFVNSYIIINIFLTVITSTGSGHTYERF